MEHCSLARSFASAQMGLWKNLNNFLPKNLFFFICITHKAPFCLCRLRTKFWKWPEQGATPGQNFHGTNHLARLPRFQVPGVFGSKVILLRKLIKIFQNFFSSLGNKKLRFVHTTKLASECMWKGHKSAGKMRRSTFQYNHLTLTYGIFHVNRNTIPEFFQISYQ